VIVIDASVAVKWLLPEVGSPAAEALLEGDERLMGPALIRVEVAAAIGRKVRFGEIETGDGESAVNLWFQSLNDGVITIVPDAHDLPRAWAICVALRHPLQDCLYLALSERLGVPLITADQRFALKAKSVYAGVSTLDEQAASEA
jgi:predicted nucleic acid-binding protein